MKVDFKAYEDTCVPIYEDFLYDFDNHFLFWGSRMSAKTYQVIKMVYFFMQYFPGLEVVLFRHEANKVRDSTYREYRKAIDAQGLRSIIAVDNESKIELINGSRIKYMGMKGNELSIKNYQFNLAIYEEAEQSLRKEFTAIETNFRPGQTGLVKSYDGKYTFQNKLIMCLNPPESTDHYLNVMFEKNEEDSNFYRGFKFLKTTIDDNCFATKEDYEKLERIRQFDEHDYLRYRYGLCSRRSEGLLFKENSHFWFINKDEFEDKTGFTLDQKEIMKGNKQGSKEDLIYLKEKKDYLQYQNQVYGHDFAEGTGADPETILKGWVNFRKKILVVKAMVYDNTLSDFDKIVGAMESAGVCKKYDIFADASRKTRINSLYNKGFKIYPVASKNPSILDTIKILREFKIYIYIPPEFDQFNPKYHDVKQQKKFLPLAQQIGAYSRKYNVKEEYFLEEPETDAKNMGIDFWDALRYMIYGYMETYGIRLD